MISGIHLATALSVMLHMEQEGYGMTNKKVMPKGKPLGEPVKTWDKTFSVVSVLKSEFPGAFRSQEYTRTSTQDGEFKDGLE